VAFLQALLDQLEILWRGDLESDQSWPYRAPPGMERRRSYLSEHKDLPAAVLVDEQRRGASSLPDNRELEDASVELNRFVQVPDVEYDGM
jgi:hypothetical protein